MKFNYYLLFLLIVITSCKKESKTPIFVDEKNIQPIDSIVYDDRDDSLLSGAIVQGKDGPTSTFKDFAAKLQKEGRWKHDINRAEKVYGFNRNEAMEYFNDIPFYKIEYDSTQLKFILNSDRFKDRLEGFNGSVFNQSKSIWGYFYRDKDDDRVIEDGIIEQWEFNTNEEALLALTEIRKIGGNLLYFNTTPYFHSYENFLFVFYTRAMAFSYEQKPVFEDFIKHLRAE